MQVKIRIIYYLTPVMMGNLKAKIPKVWVGNILSRRYGLVKVIK